MPENNVFLSIASAWELAINESLGKLAIPSDLSQVLRTHDIGLLQVALDHVDIIRTMPRHHGDPFDRMLIAQAQVEDLTIVTRERWFRSYDVKLMPA